MNMWLAHSHISRMSTPLGLALQKRAIGLMFSEDEFAPGGDGVPALDTGTAGSLCVSPFMVLCD